MCDGVLQAPPCIHRYTSMTTGNTCTTPGSEARSRSPANIDHRRSGIAGRSPRSTALPMDDTASLPSSAARPARSILPPTPTPQYCHCSVSTIRRGSPVVLILRLMLGGPGGLPIDVRSSQQPAGHCPGHSLGLSRAPTRGRGPQTGSDWPRSRTVEPLLLRLRNIDAAPVVR